MRQISHAATVDWPSLVHDQVFVAFDTETTGLSPRNQRLVEIAAVKFSLGGTVLGTFQSLIDPRIPIPYEASRVHGLYDADVRGQPPADVVLPCFFEFVGGPETLLIAHNAPFDLGFLSAECARHRLPGWPNATLCTLALSRHHLRGLRNHQLATVAAHLGVPKPPRLHRALADSMLVQGIISRLLASLSADQIVVEVRRVYPGWSPPDRVAVLVSLGPE